MTNHRAPRKRDLPPGTAQQDIHREVKAEIEHHLEERARELEAQGMDPDRAREEARRAFGDIPEIEAAVHRIRKGRRRDEGRSMMLESVMQDLKLAARGILMRPGFTAVVVGTLALGIGAVTSILSVANAALIAALPFEEADRLVFLQGAYDAPEGPQVRGASFPEFRDWQGSGSFDGMSPVWSRSVTLTGAEGPAQRLQAEQVGAGYFELMRVSPLLGRAFSEQEMRVPEGSNVALIGEPLWNSRFGGQPDIIGQSLDLSGTSFTVVGVLPSSFRGTGLQADLWLPIGNPALGISPDRAEQRGSRWLGVVARLAAGVEVGAAQAELDGVAQRLEGAYPDEHEGRIALVTPLRTAYLGTTRTLVLLVLSASALLLVIAAANVANLMLVRTTGRSGEVLVKKALGASRGRLASQFLTESLVLAALGAALGLVVGIWGAGALAAAMPEALLPAYVQVRPNLLVFLAAVAITATVGLLAGLAPTVLAARSDLAAGLREGARNGFGRVRSNLQHLIVAGEIGLALLLLVGAGLMTRSFQAQLDVRPGFDHESLYSFRVTFPPTTYPSESLRPGVQELADRLERTPGITAVTVGDGAPLRGGYSASYLYTEGSSEEDRIRFYMHRVAPGWFETLGTRVLQGRPINETDLANPEVTVISQALASRFFAGQDPVGQTLRVGRPDGLRLTIVGVAEDARFRDLTTDLVGGADDPDIYLPWDRFTSRTVDFVVRSGTPLESWERTAGEVVAAFDPSLAVFQAEPLGQALRSQTAQARFGTLLLGVFSALALTLALVGLYGVLSFAVDQRKREIAVRMAIGAEASTVRRMVVGQGLKLAALGVVVGLVIALLASRFLEAFLYGVEPLDVGTYALVSLLTVAATVAAAWLPAMKATAVDPQGALKAQ